LRALIDEQLIAENRKRAMSPDHPVLRGTAQNPDAFFQAPRSLQPVLRRLPGHRATGDGRFREAGWPRLQTL